MAGASAVRGYAGGWRRGSGGAATDGHKGEERPVADAGRGPGGLITVGTQSVRASRDARSPATPRILRVVTCEQLISETSDTCRALRIRAIFLLVGVLHSRNVYYNTVITVGLSKIVNKTHVPARK